MAKKAVVDAVEALLEAEWTACPVEGVNLSTGDVNPEGLAFIAVQYPVSNNERLNHSRTYREEGGVRLVIMAPRGTGGEVAINTGEQLAALFRERKFRGVEFKTPSSPLIHDDNEEGIYFRTSIVVPYHYYYAD